MYEGTISTGKLITITLWAATFTLAGAGVFEWMAGGQEDGKMLANLAGPVSAAAAVAHLRCYFNRLAAMVRNAERGGGAVSAPLHSVNVTR